VFVRGGLTKDVDVIAHELTHGVTQLTAALEYSKQPGALNESISDVFGSLVKQHHLKQTADHADWLIGAGILGSALHGQALRSMKAPGTANDLDRQAGSMSGYADLPDDNDPAHDNGGVHINSGIPNRAFYLAATTADSETLAPDDADRLRRTVDEAGFFDLPGDAPPSGRGPDRFHYAVTVEDDNRTHTVRRAEPDLPEELSALIDLVTSVPGRR